MALKRILNKKKFVLGKQSDSNGVALFMVIAAVAILSILASELSYISVSSRKMSQDSLDRLKAHYVAKSIFKLSLLRLKAYQHLKGIGGGGQPGNPAAGGGSSFIPPQIMEKVWNIPFNTMLFQLTGATKTEAQKKEEQAEAANNVPTTPAGDAKPKADAAETLDADFEGTITAESAKYNLNLILASIVSKTAPSPTPSASGSPKPSPSPSASPNPSASGSPTPTPTATFDPEEARKGLGLFFSKIYGPKLENDDDFIIKYRNFDFDALLNNIIAWADVTYRDLPTSAYEDIQPKRAPFYSESELHMIPLMDEELYNLFVPHLTVSTTPGINVNKIDKEVLLTLFPDLTDQQVEDFFKRRDTPGEEQPFKDENDFVAYMKQVQAWDDTRVNQFKDDLRKRNIRIVTDESFFKINVKATVNSATRIIEAYVTLDDSKGSAASPTPAPSPSPGSPPPPVAADPNALTPAPGTQGKNGNATGIKITFMRYL